MNHCIQCGYPVSRGRTNLNASYNTHAHSCLVCIEARKLAKLRYVSPAAKRWQKAKEQRDGA